MKNVDFGRVPEKGGAFVMRSVPWSVLSPIIDSLNALTHQRV